MPGLFTGNFHSLNYSYLLFLLFSLGSVRLGSPTPTPRPSQATFPTGRTARLEQWVEACCCSSVSPFHPVYCLSPLTLEGASSFWEFESLWTRAPLIFSLFITRVKTFRFWNTVIFLISFPPQLSLWVILMPITLIGNRPFRWFSKTAQEGPSWTSLPAVQPSHFSPHLISKHV